MRVAPAEEAGTSSRVVVVNNHRMVLPERINNRRDLLEIMRASMFLQVKGLTRQLSSQTRDLKLQGKIPAEAAEVVIEVDIKITPAEEAKAK